MTGLKPWEVRQLTPRDITYWVSGWNEAQGGEGQPPAMTAARFKELKARYG